MTSVYLDTNVWDFLYRRSIDLNVALPHEEFSLCITREAEFEILSIKDSGLREFIDSTIKSRSVKTVAFFGFYDDRFPPDQQRVAGFDQGCFVTYAESGFIQEQAKTRQTDSLRPTGLYKHEADVSIAARSFQSVVLSLDQKGPIKDAHKQGGKIVYLNGYDESVSSLRDFIVQELAKSGSKP